MATPRFVSLLLVALVWSAVPQIAQAGCHYAVGKRIATHADPHGHVRDFRFLGHWVYERGDIKYVAWQAGEPCDGPNCQAQKDIPSDVTFSSPTPTRVPDSLMVGLANSHVGSAHAIVPLELNDEVPSAGYPYRFEYPP